MAQIWGHVVKEIRWGKYIKRKAIHIVCVIEVIGIYINNQEFWASCDSKMLYMILLLDSGSSIAYIQQNA